MTPEETERLAATHRRVGAAFKPIFVPSQPPDPDALDLSALKVLLAEEEVYASPPQEARHLADRERL